MITVLTLVICIQCTSAFVYINVNFNNKTKVDLHNKYVKAVCENRTDICNTEHKIVCAVSKNEEIMDYKDFENSCQVFMHNICDQPKQEYYIVTTGRCSTYLKSRRNDNSSAENNANVTQSTDKNETSNSKGNKQTEGKEYKDVTQSTDNSELTTNSKVNIQTEVRGNKVNNVNQTATSEMITNADNKQTTTKEHIEVSQTATNKSEAITNAEENEQTEPITEDNEQNETVTEDNGQNESVTEDVEQSETITEETTMGIESIQLILRAKTTKFVPLYEVDTAFDDHICPLSCPEIYSPVCVSANRGDGLYFKFWTFVNHCYADLYYCKNPDEFNPPPDESAEDVSTSSLGWSYCGASRYLQFARFSEAASSLGYYGWLSGNQKYSHIMEPYERKPGYG